MQILTYTSIWPYFVLMCLFVFEASLIQKFVPFFRRALSQEMADKGHISNLDGLRGLLAISVFFTHAETARIWWITGKWDLPDSHFFSQLAVAPVGMFFLITGFLFWMKAQNARPEKVTTFFLHRLRRLYPAYLFAIFLQVLVTAALTNFHLAVPLGLIAKSLVAYLDFNLTEAPYLNGCVISPLIVANAFWSLRVEWMFYFLYPLMALLAKTRLRQIMLLLMSLALSMLLPGVRAHMGAAAGKFGLGTLMYFNFYLLNYFSFGMFVAFAKKHLKIPSMANSPLASIAGIAAVLYTLFLLPPEAGWKEGVLLMIPFLITIFGNSFFGLLQSRPLILLGQISYSTYILHGIFIFLEGWVLKSTHAYEHFNPALFWLFTAFTGAIIVGLSAISYRYLEAPFMKGYGMPASKPQVA